MTEYPSDITVTKDPNNPNTTILSRWPTEEEKGNFPAEPEPEESGLGEPQDEPEESEES